MPPPRSSPRGSGTPASNGRRWTPRVWQLTGWALPLLLALGYVALLLGHWGPGGFGSLAEVRQLFERPGLLAAGWLHYLAFDLFVGTWIARAVMSELNTTMPSGEGSTVISNQALLPSA